MNAAAVKQFQAGASGLDWTGRPLTQDGRLGPKTLWALAIADLPRYRRDIVEIACSQVGVCEVPQGSNRGVAVDGYLRPAGVGLGQPWCAAFVCWVLSRAGALEGPYTASASALLKQFRPAVAGPLPGDVFGWVNPDGTGHVGFVIGEGLKAGPNAIAPIATCEGNSSDGVRACLRPREGLVFGAVSPSLVLVSVQVDAPLRLRAVEGTR